MRIYLFAALLVVASTPALAADKPELRYEGKPLADWVTRFRKADTQEQRAAAAKAIVAFGIDAAPAVPDIIEMLSDLSPTFRSEVIELLGAIGPMAKDARPAILKLWREKKTSVSNRAFIALFPKPKEAIPDLIPFLDDPEDGRGVFYALHEMGPEAKDAIPAIRQYVLKCLAAKEQDKEKDLPGMGYLDQLGSEVVPLLVEMLTAHGGHGRADAFTCLEKLGPKAIKAAPALVKFLKHNDPETKYRAAVLLWKWEKALAVVPVLAELLKTEATFTDKQTDVFAVKTHFAVKAAKTLGDIGPDAKEALPALRETVIAGLPASVISRVYLDLGGEKHSDGVYILSGCKEYEPFIRWGAVATAGQAAADAINKIEGKAKK